MKKVIAMILTAAFLCSVAACDKPHVHSFSEEWTYDEACHWHEATCGDTDEVSDKGEHVFEEGKCGVCEFPEPIRQPVFADPEVFSEATAEASGSERERAVSLVNAFISACGESGFLAGDLYGKEHRAEGTQAKNTELTVEGFHGGLSLSDDFKVSLIQILPSYGSTQKKYYYADKDCAIEDFGTEKNYYRAEETISYLLGDVFADFRSEINYAYTLLTAGAQVSYGKDVFEIVRLEYKNGAGENARYVFAFSEEGKVAGLQIFRSYYSIGATVSRQIELLIGEYRSDKPDTKGFTAYDHKPKWAAGYPTEEVFAREYLPADDTQVSRVRKLFRSAASKVNGKNTDILAEGDIRFIYRSSFSTNDVTFDTDDIGMKVYEKSENVSRSDEEGEITIEHYADAGSCYEIVNGAVTAYIGNYTADFYSMLPYSVLQLCDFMNQYLTAVGAGVYDAYEVYVCESEFQAVKLVVEDCAEIYYIFDEEGKLLAARVEINGAEASIFTGKFHVTVPAFTTDVKGGIGAPDIGYLGVS